MASTLIFELPATKDGLILKGHPALTVMTTSWTIEGHADGVSTKVSFASDHKGNRGITDSGMTSFRFDIPFAGVVDKGLRDEVIDLRGVTAHRD